MRDPARIARIAKLLAEAWSEYPDQRLGQLLCNLRGDRDPKVFQIEDDVWDHKLDALIASGFCIAARSK